MRIRNHTKMSRIQNTDQLVSSRFAIMWYPGPADVILTSVVNPDPHWFGCPRWSVSGSLLGLRIRIHENGNGPNLTNKSGFLPFKKTFVPSFACFLTYYLLKVYFSTKYSTFCNCRTRIRMDPHWFGSLDLDSDMDPHLDKKPDPYPHWNQCESTILISTVNFYLLRPSWTFSRSVFFSRSI
jgi:hypothetical protein